MKQLKPFKVGATYKLRREMADEILITHTMIEHGYDVDKLVNDGFIVTDVTTDNMACHNSTGMAWSSERHMFYRVDNKKESK